LKKNSWIIALLVALSITAFLFTGCVSPLKVEEDNETYEEYPLDKGYNAWAGQVYQKGWAIGGIKFQGKGDAIVIAKDLGYDIDMFQRATKLKIEMPDASYPRSGVDIIWGGEDANGDSGKAGGMWNQQPIAGGSGDIDTTFAKKDGNVLIIDLQKALKNYSAYTKAAKLKIVMQVNAPSYGDVEGLVQKAFLMIPNTPPPFKPIKGLTLVKTEMYWTNDFVLNPKFDPEDASEQAIIWAIKSFRPAGGGALMTLPSLDLTDPKNDDPSGPDYANSSLGKYETAKKALLAKVNWKQEEYIYNETVWPNQYALRDVYGTIAVPVNSGAVVGEVTLTAIVKNGIVTDGKAANFKKDLKFTIKNPPDFYYKLNGVEYSTIQYGAVDNGSTSGGEFVLEAAGDDGKIRGYTATYGDKSGQYGNSAHYIEINFPAGKNLNSYKEFTCHYKSENCNLTGKSIRLKAMTKKPPRTYNPGPYIATTSFPGNGDFKEVDITFEFYKDNSLNADGKTQGGIFGQGQGADLTKITSEENASRFVTKDKDDNDVDVRTASTIYIWILPWGESSTKFTISDINFVPK